MDQNWGQRPHLPLKTIFLVSSSSDNNIIIIILSGLDGLSSIKMTANKYNIRAKRLALDNLIRDHMWKAFLISFSQLSSAKGGGGIPIIPGGGGGGSGGNEDEEERRPGESTALLCEAVVIWRHCLAAHRTLLHSLCDVPRDTPRSPPGGGSSRGVGLSPIAAPSRARETKSNAAPHGDRTRDWHRRNGGAAEGADIDRCTAGSPPHLELEAANATPRCSATGGATKTSLDIWWT
jgi:hypothetical protein